METASTEELRPLRRAEYYQLGELGAFENERVELIDGAIRRMSPIGEPQGNGVTALNELLVLALAGRARVRPQCPFIVSDISEPEPDLCVVPIDRDHSEHPSFAHLVVEVSDSSLAFDRGRKARLYAECETPEYWVVNVKDRWVEVYREPVDGEYRRVSKHESGACIRLVEFPDVELEVAKFWY